MIHDGKMLEVRETNSVFLCASEESIWLATADREE
jgi:hypothetical protein